MAPLPPLTPTPPESSGVRVPARNRSPVSDDTIWQSDAALVYVKLRKMIASDTQSTETILGTIAVAAHALTGGTGAAVAMPKDGVVVCVGRSGETAPELGDRLNVDSGISGECLRTGVIMRCDDASRDFHVDAEVCRSLGLQSIAVVPLRGQFGRVGVLEAFSNQAYAFTEDKMEILGRLAGLAEAAWARGAVSDVPVVQSNQGTAAIAAAVESPADESVTAAIPGFAPSIAHPITPPATPSVATAVPLDQVREALATYQVSTNRRKWRLAAIATSVVLLTALLSIYGWREWYKASVTSQTTKSETIGQRATSEGGDVTAAPGLAGTSEVSSAARPRESVATHRSKATASNAIPDEVIRRQPQASSSSGAGAAASNLRSDAAANPDTPPAMEAASTSPPDLGNALLAAPALPKLGTPISQGIAGGVLIHKVQPIYPPEARRMHVEGSVVINAIVTADGALNELQLVSGDPRLAPAAMEAVRQWRYTPFLLNGKPIPKQTRITISFIAPQ